MDDEKYNRDVSLLCPTCGCTQFKYEKGIDETIEIAKCVSCGREITKDELIEENMENLLEHANEIGNQALKDFAKEFKDNLKKTFAESKNIIIK